MLSAQRLSAFSCIVLPSTEIRFCVICPSHTLTTFSICCRHIITTRETILVLQEQHSTSTDFSFILLYHMNVCLIPFFFFGRPMAYEFPGQGSDANHTCDPCHSCCSPGSLNSCARPVIKLAFQHSRDAADPTAPQGQPLDLFLSPLPAYCVRQHTTFQMIQDFYFLIERALYVPSQPLRLL